jgi:transcriptional regulator with AAA-type ATPase domain
MQKVPSEIAVSINLKELKLFRRALATAAEEGLLDREKAWQRITELQLLEWQAEDNLLLPRQQRKNLSEATKAGLERQRLHGSPGPGGYFAPGRPQAKFDHELAESLRSAGLSQKQIAEKCGVSKTTIWRYFQKMLPNQRL